MLVPSRRARERAARRSGRARWSSQTGRRSGTTGGARGFRAAPHDRARRPDGRRQDQDRPPAGGAPQSAVLRFGQRDRGGGRRDASRRSFATAARRCFATASGASSRGCCASRSHVLATGGGAFMDPATRAVIARARRLGVAARRSRRAAGAGVAAQQPAAAARSGDPRAVLAELIERRHPIYAEADLVDRQRRGPAGSDRDPGHRGARRLRARVACRPKRRARHDGRRSRRCASSSASAATTSSSGPA